MRDVFYTLLVVWIIWRILDSVNTIRAKQGTSDNSASRNRRPGETTVDYIPPKSKSKHDDTGEYVDYEEVD